MSPAHPALSAAPEADRLAVWCGWLLVAAAVLVLPLGWLWPREFWIAPVVVGLFGLPAARLRDEDRPMAILLFAALIWAAVSMVWTPYHPTKPGNTTILKLAFELPLYGNAILAARRADPKLRALALKVLAYGGALFGLVLLLEAATQGALYKGLREVYSPMRADLAESKVGHSTYLLGVIWPLLALGGPKRLRPWLALAMFAGTGAAALAFGSDAPLLGLVLGPLAALAVWAWPRFGPRALAAVAAALVMAMPAIVWAVRRNFDYDRLAHDVPLTDSLRMGYWSHAIDWIALKPLRGWGLDASRMFTPGIKLHPHNAPLQVWLELGALGAVIAAVFWAMTFMRLAAPRRSFVPAAAAASAAVYFLFGVNFGVWQEWWLGLGAFCAMLYGLNAQAEAEAEDSAAEA